MRQRMYDFAAILSIALKRFFRERYSYHAAALTFTTLLAIVPLLTIIVFLITAAPFFEDILLLGERYIIENFVPNAAASIQNYFQVFIHQSIQLPTLNIIFLFFITIALVHSFEETLNDIWQVKKRNYAKKIIALIIHWAIFLFIPFIIGFGVFISSYLVLFSWISSENLFFYNQILVFLPLLINVFIFTLLYMVVPNIHVSLSEGLLGGMIASLLFEVARIGFAFYIKHFTTYALIYGAFAIIPIFLLWLYVFWFIIIFSALIIHTKHVIKNNNINDVVSPN